MINAYRRRCVVSHMCIVCLHVEMWFASEAHTFVVSYDLYCDHDYLAM